jgi:LCP family protein required for cell wall assembly
MKTTLKRGIGRSGSPNGNGRAVLPPTFLPSVALYRQPARRRSNVRLLGKVLLWLLAVLVVVASGLAGGAYLYAHQTVKELAPTSATVKLAERSLNYPIADEPATALVIGYDRRAGEEGNQFRSDTIMLVRADPHERTLSTLSFPRDLLVEVRCPNRPSFVDRINQAFATCRERGVLETVKALTGLRVHYLITVNFRGFTRMVGALGGVWIDIDRRYFNDQTGPYGYAAIDLKPGYQRLNGMQALDFVRFRHTDNDLYRIARQQIFLEAFKESVTTRWSVSSLLKVIKVITATVQVGKGGGGGPSLGTLLEYGQLAYRLPNGHFFQSRIRPEEFTEDAEFRLIADQSDISSAVWDFTHPSIQEIKDPAAASRPRIKAPPARETTVLVLNGNGVPGAAATTSEALRQRDYRTLDPPAGQEANAPRMDYANSQVYFRGGDDRARAAAEKLARLVGRAQVARLPRQLRYLSNGAMVTLIVGRSFGGLAPPAGAAPKRERAPANVRTDPGATLSTLQAVRGRVSFPVMLPHVLEKTSTLDDQMPVRVYELARRRKALRLTYKMNRGADEYWGIQMTNWDDAPVLGEPNRRRKIRGRAYELYYTGQDLRMVVVRYGGATYWVVNTLLNSLSNETMLAIAKGLKPLRSG